MVLIVLNEGHFYLEGAGCAVTQWDSEEEVWYSTTEYGWHYWLDQFDAATGRGSFNPRKEDTRPITVRYTLNGEAKSLQFNLKVEASTIEEVKTYVGSAVQSPHCAGPRAHLYHAQRPP